MGKRSAVVELFLGDMGSIQRELRPSTQREDQLTMETKLEQIAVKAVNQLPKSVVREIRTPRSVGAGGGQLPPATRWARGNSRPYRESRRYVAKPTRMTRRRHGSRSWTPFCYRGLFIVEYQPMEHGDAQQPGDRGEVAQPSAAGLCAWCRRG